jgi:hypothetical protein
MTDHQVDTAIVVQVAQGHAAAPVVLLSVFQVREPDGWEWLYETHNLCRRCDCERMSRFVVGDTHVPAIWVTY